MHGGMPELRQLEEHLHHGQHPLVAGKRHQACRAGTSYPMVQLVAPRQSQTELKLQQEGSYRGEDIQSPTVSATVLKNMSKIVSVQGIELYLAL